MFRRYRGVGLECETLLWHDHHDAVAITACRSRYVRPCDYAIEELSLSSDCPPFPKGPVTLKGFPEILEINFRSFLVTLLTLLHLRISSTGAGHDGSSLESATRTDCVDVTPRPRRMRATSLPRPLGTVGSLPHPSWGGIKPRMVVLSCLQGFESILSLPI